MTSLVDCRHIQSLIDRSESISSEQHEQLHGHIAVCTSCEKAFFERLAKMMVEGLLGMPLDRTLPDSNDKVLTAAAPDDDGRLARQSGPWPSVWRVANQCQLLSAAELRRELMQELSPLHDGAKLDRLKGEVEWLEDPAGSLHGPRRKWSVRVRFVPVQSGPERAPQWALCRSLRNAWIRVERMAGSELEGGEFRAPLALGRHDGRVVLSSAWRSWEVGDPEEPASYRVTFLRRGEPLRCAGVRTLRSARRTTIPIVTLGNPIREIPLEAQAFRDRFEQRPPHWMCHVRLTRQQGAFRSRVPWIPASALRHLAERLGIEVDNRWGYRVKLLEYTAGAMPKPHEISAYAFGLPSRVCGRSYLLPLALGMIAVRVNRPLPSWLVATGEIASLSDPELTLGTFAEAVEKTSLCLGIRPDYDFVPLLQRIYDHPRSNKDLGPWKDRAIAGEVKLAIVPATQDDDWTKSFQVETVSGGARRLDAANFGQLEEVVEELREGGLLVAQVSSIWEAVRLLNFQRRLYGTPAAVAAAEKADKAALDGVRLLRVRAMPRDLSDPIHAGIDRQKQQLRDSLLGIHDPWKRFRKMLQHFLFALKCDFGEVRMLRAGDYHSQPVLELLAQYNASDGDHQLGPVEVCYGVRAAGAKSAAMLTGEVRQLSNTASDPEFAAFLAAGLMHGTYEEDLLGHYESFLKRFGSCLEIPLNRVDGKSFGLMSLYRVRPGRFDDRSVRVVRGVAEQLAAEVVAHWEDIELVQDPSRNDSDPVQDMGALVFPNAEMPLEPRDVQIRLEHFGNDLANHVLRNVNAYRVVVRVACPVLTPGDGDSELVVVGTAMEEPALSRHLAADLLGRRVNSAKHPPANTAILTGASQIIRDVKEKKNIEQPDLCFRPDDPQIRSHASILVRGGTRVVGVAEVDWRRTGACSAATQRYLEGLAARYGLVLRAIVAEGSFMEIDNLLTPIGATTGLLRKEDYDRILNYVARMVGAQRGAIFIRDPSTGFFKLATSIGRPQWRDEAGDGGKTREEYYKPGEGLTGWVIKSNRPLRIKNLNDVQELAAIRPGPPKWEKKCYDVLPFETANSAWMGVPVAVGDEVLGVLRLASCDKGSKFGAFDQQVAMAVASRLGGHVYKESMARRIRWLGELASFLSRATSANELIDMAVETVQQGVGKCHSRIHLFNRPEMAAVSRDAEPSDVSPKGDDEIPLARFPILTDDQTVGLLQVHRPEPWRLTWGDSMFIETVAAVLGRGLRAVEQRGRQVLDLALYQTVEQFLARRHAGQPAEACEAILIDSVAAALHTALRSRGGGAWILRRGQCRFVCHSCHNLPTGSLPDLPDAVLNEFDQSNVLINPLWLPPLSAEQTPHSKVASVAGRRLADQRVAVLMRIDGALAAILFVLVVPANQLTEQDVQWAAELLARTSSLLASVLAVSAPS